MSKTIFNIKGQKKATVCKGLSEHISISFSPKEIVVICDDVPEEHCRLLSNPKILPSISTDHEKREGWEEWYIPRFYYSFPTTADIFLLEIAKSENHVFHIHERIVEELFRSDELTEVFRMISKEELVEIPRPERS